MSDTTGLTGGLRNASCRAMRATLLLFVVFAALSPQWQPVGAPDCDSKLERLRQDLAGVQLELMDVMQPDPAAASRLRGREEELKYQLRAEQIRLHDSVPCADRAPSELAMQCLSSGETPRS